MTTVQKKLRQWLRRRGWRVFDNNGGCGTVCCEIPMDSPNLPDYSFIFDYSAFAYGADNIRISVLDSQAKYVYSTLVTREALLKIVELSRAAEMELETIRDMRGK